MDDDNKNAYAQVKNFRSIAIPKEKLVELSKEKIQLLHTMKKFIESKLFTWGDFPFILPKLKFQKSTQTEVITLQNLFKKPDINELSHLASDSNGKLKNLSPEQLREIRMNGQFSVASEIFEGRIHMITLSYLQKG